MSGQQFRQDGQRVITVSFDGETVIVLQAETRLHIETRTVDIGQDFLQSASLSTASAQRSTDSNLSMGLEPARSSATSEKGRPLREGLQPRQ